jgi:ubiquinone/menaquinone biosynthesis C-methylase UbiE
MDSGRCCPWWWAYSFDNAARRLFQKPELILAGLVREGMTALDLGCGMGYYSIAMARMVGPAGRVIAVDLQEQMLGNMRRRAERQGVAERIVPVQCRSDDIMARDQVDFALAMWMVHEVPDREKFFQQVRACLKDEARFLMAEPKWHIKRPRFEAEVELAGKCGLAPITEPRVGLSHAVLLKRV